MINSTLFIVLLTLEFSSKVLTNILCFKYQKPCICPEKSADIRYLPDNKGTCKFSCRLQEEYIPCDELPATPGDQITTTESDEDDQNEYEDYKL